MPRKIADRKTTRENRRQGQLLDKKNVFGIDDPTPYQAAKRIIRQERQATHNS